MQCPFLPFASNDKSCHNVTMLQQKRKIQEGIKPTTSWLRGERSTTVPQQSIKRKGERWKPGENETVNNKYTKEREERGKRHKVRMRKNRLKVDNRFLFGLFFQNRELQHFRRNVKTFLWSPFDEILEFNKTSSDNSEEQVFELKRSWVRAWFEEQK